MNWRKPLTFFQVILLAFGICEGRSFAGEPPAPDAQAMAQFESLRALVQPTHGIFRWDRIKWETTLWDAQARAAKEGKPIVAFAVGGEVLGIC
jgi:hypothetical protein